MNQQSTKSKNESNLENSNQLEQLKRRLFGGVDDDDTNQTRILIQIMREVGGYSELINMPRKAIKEVHDFLKWESKEFKRNLPKSKR